MTASLEELIREVTVEKLALGFQRYEKVRGLHSMYFKALKMQAIEEKMLSVHPRTFDDLVDELP